jgi:predicted ATPase
MVVAATPTLFTSPLSYIAKRKKKKKITKEDIAARGKTKTCYDNEYYPQTLSQFSAKTRSKNEKMHRNLKKLLKEKWIEGNGKELIVLYENYGSLHMENYELQKREDSQSSIKHSKSI